MEEKLEEKGFPGNNLLLLALKTYKLRPTFFFPSSSMRATMKMMMKMKMRMTLVMRKMIKETDEEVMNIRMGINISPAVHCSVPLDGYYPIGTTHSKQIQTFVQSLSL